MPKPRPVFGAGRGKPGAFSFKEKAPPYEITSFALSRLLGAIHIHLPGDEAAVVARMVPYHIIVIASDVAHSLTRLLLRGGMLAEPAFAGRTSIEMLRELDSESKLNRDPRFIQEMMAYGEDQAEAFLNKELTGGAGRRTGRTPTQE